ncbi:MAG: hypothetical protein HYW47_06525 [Deltaproteobacteria bacterium]|nr:hypothetical protein [Deltaproteobacteria bacterium]
MNKKNFWDNAKSTAKKAGSFATELSKIAGTRVVEFEQLTPLLAKRFNVNRNMHKQYEQLGEMTYELSKMKSSANIGENSDVKDIMSEIRALESNLSHIESEIERVKSEYNRKVVNLKNNNSSSKKAQGK